MRRRTTLEAEGRWLPYVLLAPVAVCELLVHVLPMLLGLALSLHKIDQYTLRNWTGAPANGLDNYRRALGPGAPIGADLWTAVGVTLAFTVLVVGLSCAIGLFAAIMLSVPFRGREIVRVLFIVPFALPAFVTSLGWRFLFERDDGAVNHLLVDNLHLTAHRPFWLVGGHAFWAEVLVTVWRLWPFAFLMLTAALTTVPREQYEAAAINGARSWAQFRFVTLPTIRPLGLLVVAVLTLWTFNEFTVPWVLFGAAPPASASLVSTLVYREAFGTLDVGVAAATNVASAVILVLIGYLLVRARRRTAVVAR